MLGGEEADEAVALVRFQEEVRGVDALDQLAKEVERKFFTRQAQEETHDVVHPLAVTDILVSAFIIHFIRKFKFNKKFKNVTLRLWLIERLSCFS